MTFLLLTSSVSSTNSSSAFKPNQLLLDSSAFTPNLPDGGATSALPPNVPVCRTGSDISSFITSSLSSPSFSASSITSFLYLIENQLQKCTGGNIPGPLKGTVKEK